MLTVVFILLIARRPSYVVPEGHPAVPIAEVHPVEANVA
jgi:hypothetical protein